MTQKLIPMVEGYKIFNDDLTCRGFQFKMGMNELDNDRPLELCGNGFHFCKYPSGVWTYCNIGRVFKVRGYDVLDLPAEPGADYKLVCRRIEILVETNITGNRNTGDRNTGIGNCGHYHSGNFNIGEAPFTMFGKKANRCDVDYHLTSRLAEELTKDDPIDPTPYLSLPNATKAGIKRLHKAHIEARTKK